MQNAFPLTPSKRMCKKFLTEKTIDFSVFFFLLLLFLCGKDGFKSRHSIYLKDVFYGSAV